MIEPLYEFAFPDFHYCPPPRSSRMKEALRSAAGYVRRNWKALASLALTAFVGLNYAFELVPPATATAIVGLCAGLGIYLHHKGEPLLPKE